MANAARPKEFTARLPTVDCRPDMREAVFAAAASYGLSAADLIREAVEAYQRADWGRTNAPRT